MDISHVSVIRPRLSVIQLLRVAPSLFNQSCITSLNVNMNECKTQFSDWCLSF